MRQYGARLGGGKWLAVMCPLAVLFGAVVRSAVVATGVVNGETGDRGADELIAFLFLVNLLLIPVAELSEILDQTLVAIAGWRKILGVLAIPIDVEESYDGAPLPSGPLAAEFVGVRFSYRTGADALPHGRASVR